MRKSPGATGADNTSAKVTGWRIAINQQAGSLTSGAGAGPVTDSVLIERLTVDAVIGVYDWEREISQTLLIDLEMAWDNRLSGQSDDVDDALDYARVSEAVADFFTHNQPRLLEAAAEGLSARLRNEFGIAWLRLVIRKPGAVPQARSVGVSIERGQRP